MDEEKEKQLAARLGEIIDGKPLNEAENPELNEAADTAAAILSAFGEAPELNPAFSETLRARLVRETQKRAFSAPASKQRRFPAPPSRRWYSFAAAAVFFLFFLPTLFIARDINNRYKLHLVEKYDKMYVPYSKQLSKNDYLGKNLRPFSEKDFLKTTTMGFNPKKNRGDSFFINTYRPDKGGGDQ
ncbi:MAG: hypothetical protein WCX65_00775 [bacterium]